MGDTEFLISVSTLCDDVPDEPHMKIFDDRSVLVDGDGHSVVFTEGPPGTRAKDRLRKIKEKLEKGWFSDFIEKAVRSGDQTVNLSDEDQVQLRQLADSVTSEVGRALAGLFVLQLVVKAVEPSQSVRLHKGGQSDFSWVDGIPMRGLDANYITPNLRRYGLLRLNADGFMMTRSLAENYPYSRFYKAAIKGGKMPWVELVDKLEQGSMNPTEALGFLIWLLANRSEKFRKSATQTLKLVQDYIGGQPTLEDARSLVELHMHQSTYSARLLEIAMHSLLQVVEDEGLLDGVLSPLCQMRTANKKHRNVGDVEIVGAPGSRAVVEAWDAKYGKPYLRDEVEELADKLGTNPHVLLAGFVTDSEPDVTPDIETRLKEILDLFGTEIRILSFEGWVTLNAARYGLDRGELGRKWLVAYSECLCQVRRERAPIDEPADEWVESLGRLLQTIK